MMLNAAKKLTSAANETNQTDPHSARASQLCCQQGDRDKEDLLSYSLPFSARSIPGNASAAETASTGR